MENVSEIVELLGEENEEDMASNMGCSIIHQMDLEKIALLDKHFSRIPSLGDETKRKKQAWELNAGKVILKNLIGTGGYSTVYSGFYDGKDVAVKLLDLRERRTKRKAERMKFLLCREAEVWHALDHPNIAKLIGASMSSTQIAIDPRLLSATWKDMPHTFCLIIEYIAGGALKSYLQSQKDKKLPLTVVVQLSLDIARGLSYLHSKQIVHRDIKSENLSLDETQRVKIIDFGVARVEASDMTAITGTLAYMAPEVIEGNEYGKKCDVYSFGICLWEIFCCEEPYPNKSFYAVYIGVVRNNLRPPIPKKCPCWLASIMKHCWDGNPNNRPNMEEVVQMLEAIDNVDVEFEKAVQCILFGICRPK